MDQYSKALTQYLKYWGYYDLFLIDRHGNIVYTAKHENDFATNLNHGPYMNSGLATAYRTAASLLQAENSSFEYYPPSEGPGAFITAPIIKDGMLLGVVALQMDTKELYEVINNLTGMGATGETVIGRRIENHVQIAVSLRHDPYAAFKRIVQLGSPDGKPIHEASQGINGLGIHTDWRVSEVVAVWQYIPSMQWGMVIKVDSSEAFSSLRHSQENIIIFTLMGLMFAYLLASYLALRITRPLEELTEASDAFTAGDRIARISRRRSSKNELDLLATAFNSMADQIQLSERSLIKDRERLAVAVEQSQDSIVITDPDATIQYVNRAFEKISGYSAE